MRKVLLLIAFTPTLAAAIQILRLVAANAGFRIGRDDRFGSFATETRCPRDVRFSPDSDHFADALTLRKSARNDHSAVHSTTSSTVARKLCGKVTPRAFAVFRLITSSNLVGCSIGKSAGLTPRAIRSTYLAASRSMLETLAP
jgi:hypothetical protein